MAIFGKKKSKFDGRNPEEVYQEALILEQKNEKKAFPLYEYAAESGHADAQNKLSDCYYFGRGCTADTAAALYWAEQAAAQGHIAAQNACASMYEQGLGCKADPEKALYWYKACLESLSSDSSLNSRVDEDTVRRAILRLMPAEEATSAPTPAAKSKTEINTEAKAASAKSAADLYEEAQITEQKDLVQALALYEEAAIMGHQKAQWACANLFSDKNSALRDDCKAFCWFEKLARMGDLEAQVSVAGLYLEGIGCKKDEKKTFYWIERAAKQGHVDAQFHCGLMLFQGLGCEQNPADAYTWFRQAAEKNHSGAQEILAALA